MNFVARSKSMSIQGHRGVDPPLRLRKFYRFIIHLFDTTFVLLINCIRAKRNFIKTSLLVLSNFLENVADQFVFWMIHLSDLFNLTFM